MAMLMTNGLCPAPQQICFAMQRMGWLYGLAKGLWRWCAAMARNKLRKVAVTDV
jgi:hypothetical protein